MDKIQIICSAPAILNIVQAKLYDTYAIPSESISAYKLRKRLQLNAVSDSKTFFLHVPLEWVVAEYEHHARADDPAWPRWKDFREAVRIWNRNLRFLARLTREGHAQAFEIINVSAGTDDSLAINGADRSTIAGALAECLGNTQPPYQLMDIDPRIPPLLQSLACRELDHWAQTCAGTANQPPPPKAGDAFSKAPWFNPTRLATVARKADTAHACPVCGHKVIRFMPAGREKPRLRAKCPHCGALERHRWLWTFFKLKVWPHYRHGRCHILHFAPEPHLSAILNDPPRIDYTSADLHMPEAQLHLDITDMHSLADSSFDVVICSHILEHITDDARAMRELYRITKAGGRTLVMVPIYGKHSSENPQITDAAERLKYFGQPDHVRKYGLDIGERLTAAGFKVKLRRPTGSLSQSQIRLCGIKDQVIFECIRPPSRQMPGRYAG